MTKIDLGERIKKFHISNKFVFAHYTSMSWCVALLTILFIFVYYILEDVFVDSYGLIDSFFYYLPVLIGLLPEFAVLIIFLTFLHFLIVASARFVVFDHGLVCFKYGWLIPKKIKWEDIVRTKRERFFGKASPLGPYAYLILHTEKEGNLKIPVRVKSPDELIGLVSKYAGEDNTLTKALKENLKENAS